MRHYFIFRLVFYSLFGFWALNISTSKAQNTVILYPIEDAVTTIQMPTTNWGGHNQLSAYAWTQGGQFALHRSYLKFNYQHLSLGRPLIRATLRLKHFDPINFPHSGGNAMRISMCDTSWSEYQINWFNQPASDPRLFVDVPISSGFQDLEIDVLPLVLYQFYNDNKGLVIQLIEEQIYRMVLFGSRENEGYVPELELEFLDANSRCDTFYGAGSLEMVELNSSTPLSGVLNPFAFAIGSNPSQNFTTKRAYFKPDLLRLPPSVNIEYANLRLSVYSAQQLSNGGNTLLGLYPLNQSISSSGINWNNQPSFSTQTFATALAPETSFGVVNFDVKALIERSINLGQFHGYLLKQQNESQAGVSYFAGSGFLAGPAQPTLLVCYTANTGVGSTPHEAELTLYPNPASDELLLSFEAKKTTTIQLKLLDIQGRTVYEQQLTEPMEGPVELKLSTAFFANGVYMLSLKQGSKAVFKKVVIAH